MTRRDDLMKGIQQTVQASTGEKAMLDQSQIVPTKPPADIPARATTVSVRSTRSMKILPLGIEFTGEVTEEEWEGMVDSVLTGEKALSWALGDLFVIGADKQWGAYKRFAEKRNIDWRRLEDYAYVCRKVDFSVRTEKLSFSHHRLVAPYFDPTNIDDSRAFQMGVLREAVEKSLSVEDLKLALQRLELKALPNPQLNAGGTLDKTHKNRFNKMFRSALVDPSGVDMGDVVTFDSWWQDFKKLVKSAKGKRGE